MEDGTMNFDKQAQARLTGEIPEGFLGRIAQLFGEWDFPVTAGEGAVAVELPLARVEIAQDGAGLRARIRASDEVQLQQTREGLLYSLDQLWPGAAARTVWSGDIARNSAPPNFHLATVLSVRPVGANFLRVELACDGVAKLTAGGMHFSLLLPPAGRAPVWPALDEEGRTVWPAGDDALHRVAYTFVDLDPAAGRFSFDIFRHAGGRATGWAERAVPGERIGLTGPGGGDFPPGAFLLIAGDETALPAIRRILERSDPARRGVALIELADPGDRVALAAPAGIAVDWVIRSEGDSLWDRIRAVPLPGPEESRFVWIAAEQALARKARDHFRGTAGLGRHESYLSAYWTA